MKNYENQIQVKKDVEEPLLNKSHNHKDHDHDHKHSHSKSPKTSKIYNGVVHQETSPILIENTAANEDTLRKLWLVSAICLVFMAIEVTGGYLAGSIAIMSDAAHLFSDLLGFLISIVSIYISRRKATAQMSFGYHRAEVIGALVSVCIIWGLTLWLLYEASKRIMNPGEVNGFIMLLTAIIGFIFNIVMGTVLAYQGIDHNLHHHHEDEAAHQHQQLEAALKRSNTISPRGKDMEKLGTLKHSLTVKIADNKESHKHDTHKHEHSTSAHEHSHEHILEMNKKAHGNELISDQSDDHSHNEGPDSHAHSHGHGHAHGENVNLRAALVHVMGDALQNLGVVLAGLIIYFFPEYSIADPICTYVFSIIVTFTTIRILKDCIAVLMEGSPLEFNIEQLTRDLNNVRGVEDIHDLHVWSLSVGKLSLSCHLTSSNPQISLKKASKLCRDKYKITHSTIQVEHAGDKQIYDCRHDLH